MGPKGKLGGREKEIFAERDRRLEGAHGLRQERCQRFSAISTVVLSAPA